MKMENFMFKHIFCVFSVLFCICTLKGTEIAPGVDASVSGFHPLVLDAPSNLNPETGNISFDFTPKFDHSQKDFIVHRVVYCGKTSVGFNSNKNGKVWAWFYITGPDGKNFGVYASVPIINGQKYRITASWTKTELTLWIDGKMVGRANNKGAMPFDSKIYWGGKYNDKADGILGALILSDKAYKDKSFLVKPESVTAFTTVAGTPALQVDVEDILDPVQGSISFDYTPKFERDKNKFAIFQILSCGNASAGVNRDAKGNTFVWFLINTPTPNYGIYVKHKLEAGQRYSFVLSWDAEQIALSINGVTVGKKSISQPMPFREILILGGDAGKNADGLIENLKISKDNPRVAVVTLAPGIPGAKAVAKLVRDEQTYCSFYIESTTSPVTVKVHSAIFKFRAGDWLYIETSVGTPGAVRAEIDGELTLQLPQSFHNQIVISHTTANMFPAAALTNLDVWSITDKGQAMPTLGQGHEGFSIADIVAGSSVESKNEVRLDNGTLIITKSAPNGSVITESPAIKLQSGKQYLLTAFYKTENMRPGSGCGMIVKLYAPGKTPRYIWGEVRARNTPPGKENMATANITVPVDWQDAQVSVMFSVTGNPFSIAWRGFDLRERPILLPVRTTPALPGQMEAQITMQALLEKLQSMPARTAEVRVINGAVQLVLNGMNSPKFGYTGLLASGHRNFYDSGVTLQWVRTVSGNGGTNNWRGKPFWLGRKKYDFSIFDQHLARLLLLAPDATVMLYLSINPYPDFFKNHPEAMALDASGKPMRTENSYWQSYAAESYRIETAEMLRDFAEHLRTSPYGKAVAGIHLVGGRDGQWFPHPYDGSAGNLAAFRNYLRRIYANDLSAFRQAWGEENLTFETALLPTPADFNQSPYFLDPAIPAHRRLIDAERFRCVTPVETVELFAKTIKETVGRPFYISIYYNDVTAGHNLGKNALREVLTSPWIDGIVGVVDYGFGRLPGYSGTSVNLFDSPGLHGKVLLGELDYRTECSDLWTARSGGNMGATTGAAENAAVQRRDTGIFLTHGQGVWMYALAGNGWPFPELMQPIQEALRAARMSATDPHPEDHGEAAWFIDERMLDYLGQGNSHGVSYRMQIHQVGAKGARIPFYRSGVKFDNYLLSDLTSIRKSYRMYVFVTSPSITEEEIAYIEKNLQKDGNILIFLFDTGRVTPGGFSKTVQRLTGIKVEIDSDRIVTYRFDALDLPDPLAKSLRYFATETRGPALIIDDPTASILGYYSGTNLPGAAVKRHGNWTGIYIGAPGGITPEFLNAAAREAGIKTTADPGDAVYAGNGFLVLHAMITGQKELRWQGKRDLIDLATGKIVIENAESYSFSAVVGETRWFRLK